MSRWDDDEDPKDTTEGVRIIGADEAAEAVERGDVAPRRGEGELRFGDRPASPPEGVRPAVRFPLPAEDDAAAGVDRPEPRSAPERPAPAPAAPPVLPHWTEPPTGEVAKIFPEDPGAPDDDVDDADLEAWSSFATSGPRWRDSAGDWAEPDYDADAIRADDSTRLGALDDRDRPAPGDYFFEAPVAEEPPVIRTGVRPTPPAPADDGGERDMPVAIGIGAALAALFLLLLSVGPGAVMFLVAGVLVLAAAELYAGLQRGGYQPATLLGLVAVGAMSGAAYWKGETALPLVLALAAVFSLLWFLVGVTRQNPTMNAAVTLLGIAYVGLLGAYAALILRVPDGRGDGRGILIGVIVAVVANDVGAFVIGRQAGRAPLAPTISPHKTVEGTIGGALAGILVSFLVLGIIGVTPWDGGSALALGLVVAVMAPLGDLAESMIKRDLGVKDMGTVLPGHGGILDRFDALLFCLPATYYLARVLDLF
ncbi:MAG TPA: phosphatidate cytidylyltransferase [Acidimicrobiales bacterium]|nr:phosphatidate cytidylyltransferase [Acidimicrobiales bacterium]